MGAKESWLGENVVFDFQAAAFGTANLGDRPRNGEAVHFHGWRFFENSTAHAANFLFGFVGAFRTSGDLDWVLVADFHQFGRGQRHAKPVLSGDGQRHGTQPRQGRVAGAGLRGFVAVHQWRTAENFLANPVESLGPLAEVVPGVRRAWVPAGNPLRQDCENAAEKIRLAALEFKVPPLK